MNKPRFLLYSLISTLLLACCGINNHQTTYLSQTNNTKNSYIDFSIRDFHDSSSIISDYSKNSSLSLSDYSSKQTESFIFFTDPHLYIPSNSFKEDIEWFDTYIPLFKTVYKQYQPCFLMCGGDLLNSGDSKEEACYKIKFFVDQFEASFETFYMLAGNHDTNYLGDSWMNSKDLDSCLLSQEDLNLAMFHGGNSYYSFEMSKTKCFCFDSGYDEDDSLTPYKAEQINWFVSELLSNSFSNIVLFVHAALESDKTTLTPFLDTIGSVVLSFNDKRHFTFNNNVFDFSSSFGRICLICAGHEHIDISNILCGGVPLVISTNFSPSNLAFDLVTIDYKTMSAIFKRFGQGQDRVINI